MVYLIIYYMDVNGVHVISAYSTMDRCVAAKEKITKNVYDPSNYDIMEIEVDRD